MLTKIKVKIGIGVAVAALVLGAAGVAGAVSRGSDGNAVDGATATQARAAAVQAVPGGRAGQVQQETDEGPAAYGVAVTKPDGSTVEVQLDKTFRVLGTQTADQDGDDGDV